MMRQDIKNLIKEAIKKAQQDGSLPDFDLAEIMIEKPEEHKNGDYSSNIALRLARVVKKNYLEIANTIIGAVNSEDESRALFEKIELAPPGFINFFLAPARLQPEVAKILEEAETYGSANIGQGRRAQVEFISANPTGPLTLGNGRGGVYGDGLAKVLQKAGFDVVKEYYINDAGNQIEVLGHSVLKDSQAQYRGEYIDKLAEKISDKDPKIVGQKAAAAILESMRKTVKNMGVKFDVWFSERKELREKGKADEVVNWLKEKNLAYEKDGALWFKSTEFGDNQDRVLIKKDGQPTYFGVDCAYHWNKFVDRKFDKVINIWGADHHGDVARLEGFVKALGFDEKFEIILMQFVRLMKDGAPVRMSKRQGVYVLVDDVLAEVGRDAFRFFMLMRSADTHMDFDLGLAAEQSEKNPVYYVQYAYARICAILRKSEKSQIPNHKSQTNPKQIPNSQLTLLTHHTELNLIKQLIRLPEVIEDTARDYQVQRLPQYALDLVAAFHKFYEECRVISQDRELSQARLGLVEATQIVLKNLLNLMGVSAPEKM